MPSFKVTIKRVNASTDAAISTSFFVDFSMADDASTTDSPLLKLLVHFDQYLWMMAMVVTIWLVLANASCCTVGCCCCCSKARKRRKKEFEDAHTQCVEQVAQNDYEYTLLLMDMADLVLAPDQAFSSLLLMSAHAITVDRNATELYLLRSLLPILESERQGTRFVLRLVLSEFYALNETGNDGFKTFLAFPSPAGLALTNFCRLVGMKWLQNLFCSSDHGDLIGLESASAFVAILMSRLPSLLLQLPVEIVILCRVCAHLFPSRMLEAVHFIFFHHFMGPALLYGRNELFGTNVTVNERKLLHQVALRFVEMSLEWRMRSMSVSTTSEEEYVLMNEDNCSPTALPWGWRSSSQVNRYMYRTVLYY